MAILPTARPLDTTDTNTTLDDSVSPRPAPEGDTTTDSTPRPALEADTTTDSTPRPASEVDATTDSTPRPAPEADALTGSTPVPASEADATADSTLKGSDTSPAIVIESATPRLEGVEEEKADEESSGNVAMDNNNQDSGDIPVALVKVRVSCGQMSESFAKMPSSTLGDLEHFMIYNAGKIGMISRCRLVEVFRGRFLPRGSRWG